MNRPGWGILTQSPGSYYERREIKRKRAPEEPQLPDSRIWFMGFPDWETMVTAGIFIWAPYDLGYLPWW